MSLDLNESSWGAFAIAVMSDFPVSPEEAFEIYETGQITIAGRRRNVETVVNSCRIARLRARGCAWWSIESLTGIKAAKAFMNQTAEIVDELRRRILEEQYISGDDEGDEEVCQ